MSVWRVAASLATLRDQVNAAHPNRSKAADGTIGDAAHAGTQSEHNPNSSGVVRALDLTHDPAHGLDAGKLARELIASRDPRILYVISNGRIASSVVQPWTWRRYTGADPHTGHVHISVVGRPSLYDSTAHWNITTQEEDVPLSDAEIDKIAQRSADKVWAEVLPVLDNEKGSTAKAQLTRANVYGYRNNKLLAALTSTGYAKQIAATIVAMLPDGAVDADELARKIVVELVREVETEAPE